MQDALLVLDGIKKSFGCTEVLEGINISVAEGEFITLLGSSGCGKTTTLRVIAGLERPDEGHVYISGMDVTELPPNKRDVNTVFQNYALFPHMTVERNIGYSLRLKRQPSGSIKRAVDAALSLVQLNGYERRMPAELSGGQRQRVAIARAVVGRPKLLLLDEPLGALDLQLRRQMQTELKALQQKLGITFVYITHDQEEALNMSDRIAVMRGGRFEQIGTPDEIYDRPATSYVARFVGNANILTGKMLSTDGQTLRIRYSGGEAEVAYDGRVISPGHAVTTAVRSEYIEITPADGNSQNGKGVCGLPAVVTGKSFSAGQLRVTAVLEDGTEVVQSRHGIGSPFFEGEKVLVSFRPEHAVWVDRGAKA